MTHFRLCLLETQVRWVQGENHANTGLLSPPADVSWGTRILGQTFEPLLRTNKAILLWIVLCQHYQHLLKSTSKEPALLSRPRAFLPFTLSHWQLLTHGQNPVWYMRGLARMSPCLSLTAKNNFFSLNDLTSYWPYLWYVEEAETRILQDLQKESLKWVLVYQVWPNKKEASHISDNFKVMLWGAGGFGCMWVPFESGFFNNRCLVVSLE